MLEAALGNYEDFILEMGEDVIVLGHTHIFRNKKVLGKLKNMYYVNSGTWIDLADHVRFLSFRFVFFLLDSSPKNICLCTVMFFSYVSVRFLR